MRETKIQITVLIVKEFCTANIYITLHIEIRGQEPYPYKLTNKETLNCIIGPTLHFMSGRTKTIVVQIFL